MREVRADQYEVNGKLYTSDLMRLFSSRRHHNILEIPKQTFIIELEHEFAEKTKDFTSYCSLWRQEMSFE